jgi:hypothetical protein
MLTLLSIFFLWFRVASCTFELCRRWFKFKSFTFGLGLLCLISSESLGILFPLTIAAIFVFILGNLLVATFTSFLDLETLHTEALVTCSLLFGPWGDSLLLSLPFPFLVEALRRMFRFCQVCFTFSCRLYIFKLSS